MAEKKFSVEIQDRNSQLEELPRSFDESQQHELTLRERERKLESEKQELKLAARGRWTLSVTPSVRKR